MFELGLKGCVGVLWVGEPFQDGKTSTCNAGSWNGGHPTEPRVGCGSGGSSPGRSPLSLLESHQEESWEPVFLASSLSDSDMQAVGALY